MDREVAKTIDWELPWSGGAPCPQVFSNGHVTMLTYLIDEPTTIDTVSPYESFGVVEFVRCHSHRFGIVNDEASDGHPLYGKGLQTYAAHEIENLKWISELKQIHKVHPQFDERRWTKYKHYLLFFQDEIFECIAEGYKIEKLTDSLDEINLDIIKRLRI
jgi:hypothetical protein